MLKSLFALCLLILPGSISLDGNPFIYIDLNAAPNLVVDSNVLSPSTYAPELATVSAHFVQAGDADPENELKEAYAATEKKFNSYLLALTRMLTDWSQVRGIKSDPLKYATELRAKFRQFKKTNDEVLVAKLKSLGTKYSLSLNPKAVTLPELSKFTDLVKQFGKRDDFDTIQQASFGKEVKEKIYDKYRYKSWSELGL